MTARTIDADFLALPRHALADAALTADLAEQLQAEVVGRVPEVREQFYAISNERKIQHPAVEAILAAVHEGMLGAA